MFKTILTVLDGSPSDEAVVGKATQLASWLEAEVVLLRATVARAMADLTLAEAQVAAAASAEDCVAELEVRLARAGVRVRSAVAYGSGPEAVADTVALQGADVVVIAGPSSESAERNNELALALQRARVPILVVPHDWQKSGQECHDNAVKSYCCNNCGTPIASVNVKVDARCSRCGYFLRTCANCSSYDGMICGMDEPQVAERYRGTSCHGFKLRERAAATPAA